jgi:fused signal recognition particle receptor
MESLEKIQRTALKLLPSASANEAHPQLQKLLVIDATTGQNGLAQAKEFNKSVGISGIIVTKLDGTAKGGSLIAICRQLQLPILFVGTGETINDLQPFNRESFVAGLLMS